MYILIIEDSTNKVVKKYDVSDNSERMQERQLNAISNKVDFERFTTIMVNKKELQKYEF